MWRETPVNRLSRKDEANAVSPSGCEDPECFFTLRAGSGNRTRVFSLESCHNTIILYPLSMRDPRKCTKSKISIFSGETCGNTVIRYPHAIISNYQFLISKQIQN